MKIRRYKDFTIEELDCEMNSPCSVPSDETDDSQLSVKDYKFCAKGPSRKKRDPA